MATRTRRQLTIAALAGTLLSVLVSAPAAAQQSRGPAALDLTYQPDGRIRGGYTTTWQGDGVYNTTAQHQRAFDGTATPQAGEIHRFRISIKNAGAIADRIGVAAGVGAHGWSVRYLHGTTNITSAVRAGTFRTPSLAAGATFLIKVRLTATSQNAGPLGRLVMLTSTSDPSRHDAVKFLMTVGCPC